MFLKHNSRQSTQQVEESTHVAKVVLIGDSGTGKTSIALRFVRNEFHPYTDSTIGASFLSKVMDFNHTNKSIENDNISIDKTQQPIKRKINFNIWDTAGQEKYHSLTSMYYRNAAAAILVYDICSEVSYQSLHKWVDDLYKCHESKDILMIICGNKCDLVEKNSEERRVSREDAMRFAVDAGALYFETSARDDIGITSMFEKIGYDLINMMILDEQQNVTPIYSETGDEKINLTLAKKNTRLSCCT